MKRAPNRVDKNFHPKPQNKFENRLSKYKEKTRLKHNDEIVRINEDRRRKY